MKKICLVLFLIFFQNCQAQQLIIEPEMGRAPILSFVQHAHDSIDLVMYGFTDPTLLRAFTSAERSHKSLRIFLEAAPYKNSDENQNALTALKGLAIPVKTNNNRYQLLHQKTCIADQREALVMTFNFTRHTFQDERNFGLVIDDPAEVAEIQTAFNADWENKSFTPHNRNLVWSPDNARAKILNLINSAEKTIDMYAADLSDYQTIGALAAAARQGVIVRVLLSNPSAQNPHNKRFAFLKRAGVQVYFSKQYTIHAKVIMVDRKHALLGSINFTKPSLNLNRELSVITDDPTVIKQLAQTFEQDLTKTTFAHTSPIKPHYTKLLTQVDHYVRKFRREWALK